MGIRNVYNATKIIANCIPTIGSRGFSRRGLLQSREWYQLFSRSCGSSEASGLFLRLCLALPFACLHRAFYLLRLGFSDDLFLVGFCFLGFRHVLCALLGGGFRHRLVSIATTSGAGLLGRLFGLCIRLFPATILSKLIYHFPGVLSNTLDAKSSSGHQVHSWTVTDKPLKPLAC